MCNAQWRIECCCDQTTVIFAAIFVILKGKKIDSSHKPPEMTIKQWFDCFCANIYSAQVNENIPNGYRSQVFVMRVLRFWPMADNPRWYKWQAIACFLFTGVLFPMSVFILVFYSKNMFEAIQHTSIIIIVLTIAVKTIIIYRRRNCLCDIFEIHVRLMSAIGTNVTMHQQVARINYLIHMGFTMMYSVSMAGVVVQIIFGKPEEAILPSTSPLPYAFAQQRSVYLSVLVVQVIWSWCNIFQVAAADSLFIALINTVCGHVAQLKERLQSLGSSGDDIDFYRDLVECCKCYEDCLSFAEPMDNILSLTLFAQFGGSILNMCFVLYILSVVSNSCNTLHLRCMCANSPAFILQIHDCRSIPLMTS